MNFKKENVAVNSNRRMLNFEMTRRKIQHVAIDNGYTLGQLLMIGIYNTVSEWPENS